MSVSSGDIVIAQIVSANDMSLAQYPTRNSGREL